MADCVFCEIAYGEAPATFAGRWGEVFAIVPLNPVTPGHVLIIPDEHVPNFAASPEISGITMACAAMYAEREGLTDANVITSKGEHATQTVGHLHLHVVPRTAGDGLALPWTERHG